MRRRDIDELYGQLFFHEPIDVYTIGFDWYVQNPCTMRREKVARFRISRFLERNEIAFIKQNSRN